MKLFVTRFDYLRRGGMAQAALTMERQGSVFDLKPMILIELHFAVRATQSAPANDQQIVVPHPAASGLFVVAWFPLEDRIQNSTEDQITWPSQHAYRFKVVQLVANMVAAAELEQFDGAIPRIIP